MVLAFFLSAEAGGERHESQGISIIFFLSISLLIGSIIRALSRKSPLPYTVVLLLFGMVLHAVTRIFGDNLKAITDSVTLVEAIDPHLLFQTFLPALIFESAFSVHYHTLHRELGQAVLLAVPGVIISAALTAVFAKIASILHEPSWSELFMFGFMLSATDPVAVVALLRELGASRRLGTLIEAESLLNDGTAFVFFVLFKERSLSPEPPSYLGEFGTFAQLSFGGVALGLASGGITAWCIAHVFKDFQVETSITLVSSYLTFFIAETLEVSGVLAVVFLGLTLAKYRTVVSVESEHGLHHVWEMVSYIANTIIFILSGAIVAGKFQGKDGNGIGPIDFAQLLGLYAALHVVRGITILILLPLLNRVGYRVSFKESVILVYGGLRGAVSLALALLVEREIKGRAADLIVFHTAGIVFLTLLLNATTIKPILQYLGLDQQQPAAMKMYNEATKTLNKEIASLFVTLTDDRHFRGADWDAVKRSRPILRSQHAKSKRKRRHSKKKRKWYDICRRSQPRRASRRDRSLSSRISARWRHTRRSSIRSIGAERVEIQRRFMTGMRTMCLEQFEEGLISSTATRLLVAAIDEGLDTEDISGIWDVIEAQFRIPKWMERIYQWARHPFFRYPFVNLVLRPKLSLSVELSTGYLNASKRAVDNLSSFEGFTKRRTFSEVLREVYFYEAKTRAKWVQVQIDFPEVYRAIQTRHASDYLLHCQHKRIERIFKTGLIEEKEYDMMVKKIDEAIYRVHTRQPFIKQANIGKVTAKQDFRHLKIISHLSNKVKDRVAAASEFLTFAEGEVIFRSGEQCRGLYVIVSGVVEVRIEGTSEDAFQWYGSGSNIGAWPLLTNGKHFETARANQRTQVNVHLIPPHVVETLLNDDEVEARLWKQVGANLCKRYFRDIFRKHSLIHLTRMCDESTLLKPKTFEPTHISGYAILLLGYVNKTEAPSSKEPRSSSRLNRRSSLESHDAQAPVLLMTHWYRFSHNAKLLVLPSNIPAEWITSLQAQRLDIESSDLNMILFPKDTSFHEDSVQAEGDNGPGPRLQAVMETLREAAPEGDEQQTSRIPAALLKQPEEQETGDTTTPSQQVPSHGKYQGEIEGVAFNLSVFERLLGQSSSSIERNSNIRRSRSDIGIGTRLGMSLSVGARALRRDDVRVRLHDDDHGISEHADEDGVENACSSGDSSGHEDDFISSGNDGEEHTEDEGDTHTNGSPP